MRASQVEQSYKILHSSCIYLARQIGRYLTRILQIARKCTQNEAFLARSGYILARSCTNLAITACKNCVLNGRRARINGSCKVLQDSLQEFIAKPHVEILACKCILLARSIILLARFFKTLRVVGHPAHALFSALPRFLSSNLQRYTPNKGFPASNYHYSSTLPKNEAARSKLKDSRSYFILWMPTSVHLRIQWARVAAQQCAAVFSS